MHHLLKKDFIKAIHYLVGLNLLLFCFYCNNKNHPNYPQEENGKWMTMNLGLTNYHIQALTVDLKDQKTLYASSSDGIFKSENGGTSWHLSNNGMLSKDVKILLCDPQNSNKLYAGTWGKGIFVSDDGGANWRPINNGINDLRILSIHIDPNNQDIIYAASETEFLVSTNRGTTWTARHIPVSRFRSLGINYNSNIIYAGTFSNGVLRSYDLGMNWESKCNGLRQAPGEYYEAVEALQVITDSSFSIWAAIEWSGVYRSHNDGQNWQSYSSGLPGCEINCMTVDKVNFDIIALGTPEGVYFTQDGAKSWYQINHGLDNKHVRALIICHDPLTIFVGTMGGGVYRYIVE